MNNQQSQFREREGYIDSVTKLVLNNDQIPSNVHMFYFAKC